MSKSRHNHKWFDDEEDDELHMGRNRSKFSDNKNDKLQQRREQRKHVQAAKTQILNTPVFTDEE